MFQASHAHPQEVLHKHIFGAVTDVDHILWTVYIYNSTLQPPKSVSSWCMLLNI
jgi:hypothetical protein